MRSPSIAIFVCQLLLHLSTAYVSDINDELTDSVLQTLAAKPGQSVLTNDNDHLRLTALKNNHNHASSAFFNSDSDENDKDLDADNGDMEHLKAKLVALGKRGWRTPFSVRRKLLLRPAFQKNVNLLASRKNQLRRRSQQLSVSGPLSALANMLAAEGRRMKQSEAHNNRMRLLELGKRSNEILQPDAYIQENEELFKLDNEPKLMNYAK